MHKEHTDDREPVDYKEQAMINQREQSRKYWAECLQESDAIDMMREEGRLYEIKGKKLLQQNNPNLFKLAGYFYNKAKSFYEKLRYPLALQRCEEAIKSLESKCNN